MIEINLVPDVKQELNKAERIRGRVISGSILVGMIALGVVAILAVYVFAVQTVRSAILDEAIKKGGEQLASVEDLSKILTIQNQLGKISELNSQKHMDSRVFDVLAAVIPPAPNDIKVSNLIVDAEAADIAIEGQASGGYKALEVFKKTIDGAVVVYSSGDVPEEVKLAANISTTDVSYGEDTTGSKVLRFRISFTYPEELFSPLSKSVTFKIVNEGNVTDSYLGVPKSIFGERAADLEGEQ